LIGVQNRYDASLPGFSDIVPLFLEILIILSEIV
jgi:hypothetical protein